MGIEIRLRKAILEDSWFLFDLRNDEAVRRNSFSIDPITYENHCVWLRHKLEDPNCGLWIAQYDNSSIGQIRIDKKDGWGEISYSLCAQARGRNFGKQMITQLEQVERNVGDLKGLLACVKKDNEISRHIFGSLGYDEQEQDEHYVYRKRI
ncbi:MAG: GNAT family N-acetyltransferase [Lachnospira sp.]|nr:GNAT family N-acetyltransferase [Lachnospira sp.]